MPGVAEEHDQQEEVADAHGAYHRTAISSPARLRISGEGSTGAASVRVYLLLAEEKGRGMRWPSAPGRPRPSGAALHGCSGGAEGGGGSMWRTPLTESLPHGRISGRVDRSPEPAGGGYRTPSAPFGALRSRRTMGCFGTPCTGYDPPHTCRRQTDAYETVCCSGDIEVGPHPNCPSAGGGHSS